MKSKGISAVIASVLILMITVALGGTAYLYMSDILTGRTSNAFSIADSYNDTVTIRNEGTDPIREITATVDGTVATTVFNLNEYLIIYWKMNEGSGTKSQDSSPNKNDFDLGSSDSWADGKFGKAISFGNIGWSHFFLKAPSTVKTMTMWFKTTSTAGTNLCFSGGGNTIELCGNSYNAYYSGADHRLSFSYAYNDGSWHFIGSTEDSSGTTIYFDDAIAASSSSINQVMDNMGEGNLNGGCGHGCAEYPSIIIDEVKVYNKTLSGSEMTMLYNSNGETVLEPGKTLTLKFTGLSRGSHAFRLCTGNMCNSGSLGVN